MKKEGKGRGKKGQKRRKKKATGRKEAMLAMFKL